MKLTVAPPPRWTARSLSVGARSMRVLVVGDNKNAADALFALTMSPDRLVIAEALLSVHLRRPRQCASSHTPAAASGKYARARGEGTL